MVPVMTGRAGKEPPTFASPELLLEQGFAGGTAKNPRISTVFSTGVENFRRRYSAVLGLANLP
jgi:hypothetical protein